MKRLFRGLRNREPRAAYDAVVIGAGVGGLVAANLLARAGLSVLLVEQHYMVGGYCSTFRRGGFTFDASTHFYPLLGNPATLTGRLLAELGVETEWVPMDPVDTFHLPDGSRFEVPADFDLYRARLDAEFPGDTAALDAFFAEVREAYLLGLLEYFRERPTPRLDRFRDLSLGEVLDRHFQDERLKLVLTADCPHWGSPPGRTSFVFDSMLRLSYFLGNYYPVGGSQAFADELAHRFEEHGGEILMSSAVERIRVAGRGDRARAVGVEIETLRGDLRGRRTIGAGVVVAGSDLLETYERLLGPEHVAPEEMARLARLRPSYPCFLTHLGVQGADADALASAQGYYWRAWDAEQVGEGALVCKVFCSTLYDPSLAPPGGHVVMLQKVLAIDPQAIGDWAAHKAAVESEVTEHLEQVIPGIGEKTVVRLSATASTARRFTRNHRGAMLGWEMAPDQLGAKRPGIAGPIAGLWHVGHWVRPGGGITPVIVSAQRVAAEVLGSRERGVGERRSLLFGDPFERSEGGGPEPSAF